MTECPEFLGMKSYAWNGIPVSPEEMAEHLHCKVSEIDEAIQANLSFFFQPKYEGVWEPQPDIQDVRVRRAMGKIKKAKYYRNYATELAEFLDEALEILEEVGWDE